MLRQAEDAQRGTNPDDEPIVYSCGELGHDYTDHLVVYEGQAILDINLPKGAKARPLTGRRWTEVDREIWSDDYKGERKEWDFDKSVSGSFSELRKQAAQNIQTPSAG